MAAGNDKHPSVIQSLDWWTIGIYLVFLVFGWISVCGATYTYGDNDLFSLGTRSGMQLVWIGTSLCIGLAILLIDSRFFNTFAYLIYGAVLLLLFVTIFNPHDIKGSHSWIVLGPLRLQPAEFGKFATALALAKLMSSLGFNITTRKHIFAACGIILLPMLCIIGQRETGSALVYLSFFFVLYREGMHGSVLITGIAMIVFFIVGIKYEDVILLHTTTSLGTFAVLLLVHLFTILMVWMYSKSRKAARIMLLYIAATTALAVVFAEFILPFNIVWVQIALCIVLVGHLLYLRLRISGNVFLYISLFTVGSLLFFYSADYVLNNVMEQHQRTRINVLLGLENDLSGAGYNVHQSTIAIGSGGLTGKGFLNGTQNKLKFVPEKDTDFIFCTVGEEEGFIGAASVLLLFLCLILRLIHLAERQPFGFERVYGYSVVSVFFFHVFINVGMVLGLTPVIGIPLPFFSYGGSSLWGFTILLFTFLRFDAERHLTRRYRQPNL